MSHGDQLSEIPADFHVIGHTSTAPFAAIVHNDKPWYGVQFHPEVTHSPRGREVIGKFVLDICRCSTHWTMVSDEYPECGRTLLTIAGIDIRRSLSARKSRASARSVGRMGG